MINGIVYGLICAAILSLFDVDEIFITSTQPFFKKHRSHQRALLYDIRNNWSD